MNSLGFILQTSYRTWPRPGGPVPVVQVYGRLASGESFLLRDDRQRPRFFVRVQDLTAVRNLLATAPAVSDWRTFNGEPVASIEQATPADVPGVRERLHANGIATFEADVRFATRYMIERGIKGGCAIQGAAHPGTGVDWIFDNPSLEPHDSHIEPRVLAFDIETCGSPERLLAISLFGADVDEVLIVDGSARAMPDQAIRCHDERSALARFCQRVEALDPDVLTGWNVIDFDLAVLVRIASRVNHPLRLGRDAEAPRIRTAQGYFGSGQAQVAGRLVLDGIDLLRGAFIRQDDYSLDAVARAVLGEGKAVSGDVRDRVAEINHNYRHDLAAFALYARTDARLAFSIVERLNLVRLAFARSKLAGMTPDRVAASIASFDFLYLSALKSRKIVAPTVGSRADDKAVTQYGGHVLAPMAGLHTMVWVFDFKSLYPSIIRTFNIDPLSLVAVPAAQADLIRISGGAFGRSAAILPALLDELFLRREAAKTLGDEVAAHATKILMNSFYGVLGTPACRFYNPALTNAITSMGRELLLWSKRWFEHAGFPVIYGDTDSLFVLSHGTDPQAVSAAGTQWASRLTEDLTHHIAATWNLRSRLELKFEKLYCKLLLPLARHSTRGASKRYAGLRYGGAGTGIEFIGMEVVRRDWTALAKEVQRELYRRLFLGETVDTYLADVVRRVRRGDYDQALVYRKNLRKGAADYTATPPHVAAARKSKGMPERMVSYIMTLAGPEPTDNIRHDIDREHYVTKQVKPVAEPVLTTLGLDFERVIGDSRQIELGSL